MSLETVKDFMKEVGWGFLAKPEHIRLMAQAGKGYEDIKITG